MIQTRVSAFWSILDGVCSVLGRLKNLKKLPNKSSDRAVASNLKMLHFVSDKTAFHTLPFNKYLPHTEDKVLALKEINNLTGYSEKCQLPFKKSQSFQDVWVRLAIQTQPFMNLCDTTDVFLERRNQWCPTQAFFFFEIPLISHWHVGKTPWTHNPKKKNFTIVNGSH